MWFICTDFIPSKMFDNKIHPVTLLGNICNSYVKAFDWL